MQNHGYIDGIEIVSRERLAHYRLLVMAGTGSGGKRDVARSDRLHSHIDGTCSCFTVHGISVTAVFHNKLGDGAGDVAFSVATLDIELAERQLIGKSDSFWKFSFSSHRTLELGIVERAGKGGQRAVLCVEGIQVRSAVTLSPSSRIDTVDCRVGLRIGQSHREMCNLTSSFNVGSCQRITLHLDGSVVVIDIHYCNLVAYGESLDAISGQRTGGSTIETNGSGQGHCIAFVCGLWSLTCEVVIARGAACHQDAHQREGNYI